MEDELCLGESCGTLRFIAATELSREPFEHFAFDGVLGLGLEGLSQSRSFNVLEVFAPLRGVEKVFGIFLGRGARLRWGDGPRSISKRRRVEMRERAIYSYI